MPAIHAATVTWGGAGSEGSPAFWNISGTGTGQNGDVTHWGQASPPTLDGTDDAVINGGGIQKNGGHDYSGGSTMTLNTGAYFVLNATTSGFTITGASGLQINDGNFNAQVNFITVGGAGSYVDVVSGSFVYAAQGTNAFGLNGGATATVHVGATIETTTFFNTQNSGATAVGGSFILDGGTILASGVNSNPLRATNGLDGGGFDFTALGGTIQIDDLDGGNLTSYLEGKATTGFFKIDGTTVSGFGSGNAVGGEWLELTDTSSSGSIMLVPEPSSAVLAGLAGLAFVLRRRR